MYDIAALYEAGSVAEAVALRQAHPHAVILAGGTDVMVQMHKGKLANVELLSIHALEELRGVTMEEDGTIRIGSLTTFTQLTQDELVCRHLQVLAHAADQVGGPQIRNVGTIGGNTCNGITSADTASSLLALDALVELTGASGKRLVPIAQFYLSAGHVDLHDDEIQTALLIRKESYEGFHGHFIKYAIREAMDVATLGCSANVKLSADGKTIEAARIAYGVAGPVPMRAPTAEAAAAGKPVCTETINTFAQAVLHDISPRDSWRSSKAFREHLAVELAKRCLTQSITLAGGIIE